MSNPPDLTPADLRAPVRRAIDRPGAEVIDWSAEAIAWQDFGGGSRALHRVTGTARAGGSAEPLHWSIVLKTLVPTGEDERSSDEPGDYAYWRRESLLYASGLLDEIGDGLRAARCWAVDSQPNRDRVWLEDLREAHPAGWSVERFALAARHLGRFNGAWLAGRPIPREPWLSGLESVQEFWNVHPATRPGLEALLDREAWASTCRAAGLPPAADPAALRACLRDRRSFLAHLSALPQTFCHHDAIAPNLFAVASGDGAEETIAIDWQLSGPGPAGADLAMLVAGSVLFLRLQVGAIDELDRRAFEAYLLGLGESGAAVDDGDVRYAYAAASVLRIGAILASWIRNLANVGHDDDREWSEQFWGRPAEALIEHWGPLVDHLERLAGVISRSRP